jgi:eukaryotic-like serine/threonine-protein kinase
VERGVQIPIDVACGMVTGVLHGLHAAHEVRDEEGVPLDIVHRDVSPQNILVARDGVARVLDFGVAKALAQSPNTQSGLLKGKFGYMGPEQIMRGHVDRRTDVFAAGVVLWETLTCRRLFQSSKNIEQALARVVAAEIPAPSVYRPEIPEALDAIVLRAVERDPERRFQSAEDLAVALEEVGGASPHLVKTWFSPLASPELVQRATLIRTINRRYGTPGRSTPHPSELVEEARLALASARAVNEAAERAAEAPVQAPRRSGRFAMHLGWGRAKMDSGVVVPRSLTPPSRRRPEEPVVSTTRSRFVEPAPEETQAQLQPPPPLRISVRHAGGALLALVMLVATWVTAVGQTALPPLRAGGPAPGAEVPGEPRSGASGALDSESPQHPARADRDRVRLSTLPDGADGRGPSLRKPERVTVPAADLELRPRR